MRTSSTWRLAWVAALLSLSWGLPSAADYRLVDLGSLPTTGSPVISGGNADGAVVGTISMPGGRRAFSHGGASVTLPGDAVSSNGLGINGKGDVTGSFVSQGGGASHAYRTVMGTFQDLGTLQGGSAVGTAIDDAGDVVGYGFVANVGQRAFRALRGGSLTVIDPLAGGSANSASGINSAGTVVGTSDIGYQVNHAFVTDVNGRAVDLLALHANSGFVGSTYATGINETGAVIGYGSYGLDAHAFLALPNTSASLDPAASPLIDLGVTGSASSSRALGLNNRNQVVGTLGYAGGTTHAFVWDPILGMIDLNTVLTPLEQQSWTLSKAFSIGDLGQIGGIGYLNGQLHAFTLVPATIPSTVPEPPAWAMTGLGGSIAAGWAAFRSARKPARAGV